jgi:uncharacterized protein YndB with AHSA1/START domain
MPEPHIISPVSVMVSMLLATGLAGSAAAEVKSVAPSGFEVVEAMTIHAPPDQIYAALGKIGQWWSSSHTFSRDSSNLSLDLKAGGCFCERLKDGGSVQHLIVVYAAPSEGLRLRGALGPLQLEGVDGTLAWSLKPSEGGTNVTQSYVVGDISAVAWTTGRQKLTVCCMSSSTACGALSKQSRSIDKSWSSDSGARP